MSSYKQIIKPTVPFPYVGGWCQGFVEGSFGQASKPKKDANGNWYTTGPYPSASAAWKAGRNNHPNQKPPKGVAVAVYFSLGSTPAGHVAIHMPDGKVLSSSQGGWHSAGAVHPNLQHMIDAYAQHNNGCKYLGWTEYVGKAKVVEELKSKKVENIVTPQLIIDTFKHQVGVVATPEQANNPTFLKMSYAELRSHIRKSVAFKNDLTRAKKGNLNPVDHLPGAIQNVYKPFKG